MIGENRILLANPQKMIGLVLILMVLMSVFIMAGCTGGTVTWFDKIKPGVGPSKESWDGAIKIIKDANNP